MSFNWGKQVMPKRYKRAPTYAPKRYKRISARVGRRPEGMADPQILAVWVEGSDLKHWKRKAEKLQMSIGELVNNAMLNDSLELRRHHDDF